MDQFLAEIVVLMEQHGMNRHSGSVNGAILAADGTYEAASYQSRTFGSR